MKKLKHLVELILVHILFTAFRAIPLDIASHTGGWMARCIGPFMSAHKTADKNLSMIFPAMNKQQRINLLMAMWDNLGRSAAELAHLPDDALYKRMEVSGLENLPNDGKPVIFFSGHLGNWELSYPIAQHNGLPITLVYRQANNLYVDRLISSIRATQASDMFPKGAKGSFKMLRALKDGHSLAMLVDQKMNDGIPVPFFGRDAMTAPAIAELALRYDLPLIPARVIRTKGAHFKAVVYPPLQYEKTGDETRDALAIMTQVNAILESWIREYPEQWFWVHKRWPNA
jgi:KDO2-lipid IV(A) lauroyltransferase